MEGKKCIYVIVFVNGFFVLFTGKKDKNKEKKHKNKAGKKVKEKKEEKDDKEDKDERAEHVQFEETPQILPPEPPVQVGLQFVHLFLLHIKKQLFHENRLRCIKNSLI